MAEPSLMTQLQPLLIEAAKQSPMGLVALGCAAFALQKDRDYKKAVRQLNRVVEAFTRDGHRENRAVAKMRQAGDLARGEGDVGAAQDGAK